MIFLKFISIFDLHDSRPGLNGMFLPEGLGSSDSLFYILIVRIRWKLFNELLCCDILAISLKNLQVYWEESYRG